MKRIKSFKLFVEKSMQDSSGKEHYGDDILQDNPDILQTDFGVNQFCSNAIHSYEDSKTKDLKTKKIMDGYIDKGDVSGLKEFLKKNPVKDINAGSGEYLRRAIFGGDKNIEITKTLVENGSDPALSPRWGVNEVNRRFFCLTESIHRGYKNTFNYLYGKINPKPNEIEKKLLRDEFRIYNINMDGYNIN